MLSVMQQTSPSLGSHPRISSERHQSGVMEINVGGQTFSTTRETLEAAGTSFFSGLISGNFGVQRDSKGHIFIDRDRKPPSPPRAARPPPRGFLARLNSRHRSSLGASVRAHLGVRHTQIPPFCGTPSKL
jgi:hypothetical protein